MKTQAFIYPNILYIVMIIKLHPGLKCKKCDARIKIVRDIPGDDNLMLLEDAPILFGKFEIIGSCEECVTVHHGKGFVRDGVFRGIYEYDQST
jgi:hypothetical protein